MIGTVIDDELELFEKLGQGHLGIVYKARSTSSGRLVAVKVLQRNDARSMQRFKREAKAASRQDHPNIVKVYDVGIAEDGKAYIVMELVSGEPLRDIIRCEAPLTIARVKRIFSQICDALTYLHSNGIVHRDLKPANIMVVDPGTDDECVKLVDFGLAKPIDPDEAERERVTLTGHVTGTPAYMSPEQCQARPVDERSDIYSLACVMYRALTGLPPVTGATAQDTMNKQVAGQAVSFERLSPAIQVPDDARAIVIRASQTDPGKRYQTAADMKADIESLQISDDQ